MNANWYRAVSLSVECEVVIVEDIIGVLEFSTEDNVDELEVSMEEDDIVVIVR